MTIGNESAAVGKKTEGEHLGCTPCFAMNKRLMVSPSVCTAQNLLLFAAVAHQIEKPLNRKRCT